LPDRFGDLFWSLQHHHMARSLDNDQSRTRNMLS
jgi:hypothetical protein